MRLIATAENAAPVTPMRFIRLPEVERITGIRRSAIYKRASDGAFPKPIKLSACASVWIESEVQAWMAGEVARSRAA